MRLRDWDSETGTQRLGMSLSDMLGMETRKQSKLAQRHSKQIHVTVINTRIPIDTHDHLLDHLQGQRSVSQHNG